MTDDTLLSEQLDYYRARAGEYDMWWLRQGRFDRGTEANELWFAQTRELERVLARFDPRGDVLELACGTGLWTRHLAEYATRLTAVDASPEVLAINRHRLTAVDASPEVLAINRQRVGAHAVRYVQADLFDWRPPPAGYDACVFTFWLSHVPADRFAPFWEMVTVALRPGGRVLFIDSARTERSTAADHQLPGEQQQTMTRRLDDGREFQIVKRFYEPDRLTCDLAQLGWNAEIATTGEFFIYGTATRFTPRP